MLFPRFKLRVTYIMSHPTVADPEGGTGGTCPPLLFLNSLSHSYNLDSKL